MNALTFPLKGNFFLQSSQALLAIRHLLVIAKSLFN